MKNRIMFFIVCLLLTGCSKDSNLTDIEHVILDEVSAADTKTVFLPASLKEADKYVQYEKPVNGDMIAMITVDGYGIIYVKLFDKLAPDMTANFIELVNEGYYNNMPIYRVFNEYLIQVNKEDKEDKAMLDNNLNDIVSDIPTAVDIPETKSSTNYLKDPKLYPFRGALCMANMGMPDTNTSSFFIIQAGPSMLDEITYLLNEGKGIELKDYIAEFYHVALSEGLIDDFKLFGGAPWLTGRHTIFGQIYEGFDILDKIAEVDTDESGIPYDDIMISSIMITEY